MINKIVPQKLDSSLDLKVTKPDTMVDALNISISNSLSSQSDGSGDVGVLKNILGTEAASLGNLPIDSVVFGEAYNDKFQVIGSVTDIKTKVIYYFLYSNRVDTCAIYAYDPLGRLPVNSDTPAGIPNSTRLILRSKRLKFPQNGFVKADVVHIKRSEFSKHPVIKEYAESKGYWDEISSDCIIYFTDNKNEPRKINVYRALLNNSLIQGISNHIGYSDYSAGEFDDFISACPRTPLEKIQFTFLQDPNFKGSNFAKSPGMVFAYQFVYEDGIESSISSYSDLAAPTVMLEQGSSTYVNYALNNVCELTIPTYNKEVSHIRLLSRQHDTSSFLLIDEFPTTESTDRWNHETRKYRFYNDRVLTGVSDMEVVKQFDAVPKRAYTQTISNNRLMYGNYVEGFDNVKVTATITPEYEKYPDQQDIRVYVTPSIRSTGRWDSDTTTDVAKWKRNKQYNGGASFIIDVDASSVNVAPGSTVTFSMSIAPDRNFHIYRKSGWAMPSNDHNTVQRYESEGALNQPYPTTLEKNNLYATEQPVQPLVSGGLQSPTWSRYDVSGNQSSASCSFGNQVIRPLILQGGQLTFGVQFKYTGDTNLIGQSGANIIGTVISYSITNRPIPLNILSQIEIISSQSTFTHNINLGLSTFDRITSNAPGEAESDPRAYLVTPVFNSSSSYGPVGYFIVNSANATFALQHVASGVNSSVNEVLLRLSSVSNIEACTCIRRPNNSSDWIVLKPSFFTQTSNFQQLQSQFVDAVNQPNITNLFDFYKVDVNENLSVDVQLNQFQNFKNQFGRVSNFSNITASQLKYNEFWNTAIQDVVGVCVTDGESGLGGYNYEDPERNNPGSIYSFINFSEVQGFPYVDIYGYFFTGSEHVWSGLQYQQVNFVESFTPIQNFFLDTSYLPLRLVTNSQSGPYKTISAVYKPLRYSQIEITSLLADSYTEDNYNNFRTFKTNSSHDFGVVYYDERGRHGFVNPIGSLFIPGYSNQERGPAKGKVNVSISIPPSQHPSWATQYKIVHSRSTSIESFVQYTAGGAYVRHSPQNDENDNIYVSLNYLQSSVASYVSAFGAKSPEGGLAMYKFQQGDRVRVISYSTDGTTYEYPYNVDFEVVDMVELGLIENPLYAGSDQAPYKLTGQFLVVKDSPGVFGFDYQAVKNGVHYWDNNCIIEIYRPSKLQDQANKIFYEVSDVQRTSSFQPILLENGDVWWRPVALNLRPFSNGNFDDILVDTQDSDLSNTSKSRFRNRYLETETCTDLNRGNNYGLGRPNSVFKQAIEARNESGIVYSQPTPQMAPRLMYSHFNQSLFNFKDLPEIHGFISYMIDRGDHIAIFQEGRCSIIPVGRQILNDASGNDIITASTNVLGSERYLVGQVGCDGTPESVVEIDGIAYFVNKAMGLVVAANSSTLDEVSSVGMESAIRDAITSTVNSATTSGKAVRLPGGYDQVNKEYIFTVKEVELYDEIIDPPTVPGDDEQSPDSQEN
jgi:hypothetical protein